MTILVAEDDRDIAELIGRYVKKAGWTPWITASGDDALSHARKHPVDLAILDVMLPGMSGLEVCRSLRSDPATAALPIIIVTARAEETDRIIGLEIGADDYISKPFSPNELVARIRALMRRSRRNEPEQYLMRHRGRVLSRDLLLADVWGYTYTGGTRTVDVHVRRLREKLPVLVDRLVTVKQFGYKLMED
jgi:two-component system, OmpR family, alkaline phosphatase synthesis response regulator PhoP